MLAAPSSQASYCRGSICKNRAELVDMLLQIGEDLAFVFVTFVGKRAKSGNTDYIARQIECVASVFR
jgi:hypothetical protein